MIDSSGAGLPAAEGNTIQLSLATASRCSSEAFGRTANLERDLGVGVDEVPGVYFCARAIALCSTGSAEAVAPRMLKRVRPPDLDLVRGALAT
jgi:hypothetical protein